MRIQPTDPPDGTRSPPPRNFDRLLADGRAGGGARCVDGRRRGPAACLVVPFGGDTVNTALVLHDQQPMVGSQGFVDRGRIVGTPWIDDQG